MSTGNASKKSSVVMSVAKGACALLLTSLAVPLSGAADPLSFADPFVGTSANGHTVPGACVPMGMVQPSPDTGTFSWGYCGGYRHEDTEIYGFSQTHIGGGGCTDLGDVLLLPFTRDERTLRTQQIDKASERAEPGYYAVRMTKTDVFAEMTATDHAAIYRFTYNGKDRCRLLVDGQWVNFGAKAKRPVREEKVQLDGKTGLSGWRVTDCWCRGRRVAFVVAFDHPFTNCVQLAKRNRHERGVRYAFDFALKSGETLTVKVAVSRRTEAAARANLMAEIPGWDFDGVRAAARQRWRDVLGRAEVEGTDAQKRTWYSALYHLYIHPHLVSDVGEKPFYSEFSCWDTFRAASPFYTLFSPTMAGRFAESLLEQGRITGYLPIWPLWGKDVQCMIGTHSIPMIVDTWLKGAWRGDAEAAYAQIKDTLTKRHPGRTKEDWDLYDRYGYYPFDKIRREAVSRTLECCYDDWCAAQMAKRLGKAQDAAFFLKRANYWKNLYDPSVGFMRGRDTKGNWRPNFNPYKLAGDFTEGNSYQYTWHVLHDPAGLIAAMGGAAQAVKRLDELFAVPTSAKGMGKVLDVTGLIGQYAHGNEPSHHTIYFYALAGRPDRTAERLREVCDTLYAPTPTGLCGNEDLGQMSAWYLFSTMGFYPFNPCGGDYLIGAPQLPRVTLRLENGKVFVVEARGLSKTNKYVKSVTLNGKPLAGLVLKHADILRGGRLVFEMTDTGACGGT